MGKRVQGVLIGVARSTNRVPAKKNRLSIPWGRGLRPLAVIGTLLLITLAVPVPSARAGWAPWGSLGGSLTSGPAAASWGPGRLDVFARGANNNLVHRWYAGGWSGWESLGGVLESGPAAVSWGPGRLDVFVVGAGGIPYHRWYAGGWSAWERMDGVLTADPAVSSWGLGRLDLFGRGTNGALYHKFYDGGWSAWERLGGGLVGGPGAVSWGSGRIDVFATGTNQALYHRWYAGGWSGWEPLGGVLTADPAVSSWSPGRLDVFVRGSGNALSHRWYAGGWSGWESLGGALTSEPAAVSWSYGRVDVVARGASNALYHRWFQLPPPPVVVSPGTYRVNVDIGPGTYRTRSPAAGCYWERLRGFSGSFGDIIANEFTNYITVVTISPSDVGFRFSDCAQFTNDLSPVTGSPSAPFGSGQFIVGVDISGGTWQAPGGASCYWERESGFGGTLSEIIANGFGDIGPIVSISPSDRGFKTNDCGSWTKIG